MGVLHSVAYAGGTLRTHEDPALARRALAVAERRGVLAAAAETGINDRTIREWCDRLGVEPAPALRGEPFVYNGVTLELRVHPPEAVREALDVYQEWGTRRASEATGIGADSIRRYARKTGVALPNRLLRQMAHTGLSASQLRERTALAHRIYYAGNAPLKEAAAAAGAPRLTVERSARSRGRAETLKLRWLKNGGRERGERAADPLAPYRRPDGSFRTPYGSGITQRLADDLGVTRDMVVQYWYHEANPYGPNYDPEA